MASALKSEKSAKEYYASNPLDYFRDRLGIKPETINWNLLPQYKEHNWDGTVNPFMCILNALVNNQWCGVESATGTGKTFIGALIVLWFLDCFDNSLVVTTAPKEAQLSLHIWKEIGKLHSKFNKGSLTSLQLNMSDDPNKKDHLAVGFVAGVKAGEEASTKAAGFHAENLLIILEETPGIPGAIIAAFNNTCTSPHNLILAFGNPDSQSDQLHTFCKQPNVTHIRISAYDHPNVVLNNASFIPGAASIEGIKRIQNRFGEGAQITLSRTRGISPTESQDSLIKLSWCHAARDKWQIYADERGRINESEITGKYSLGVDVANSDKGDKAAIARGRGDVLIEVNDFQCPDANQLGKRDVLDIMKRYNISPQNVGVDGVGVGVGTINALKEMKVHVLDLKGGAAAERHSGAEEFKNLRSQMYWQLRQDLQYGLISLPDDAELFLSLIHI